ALALAPFTKGGIVAHLGFAALGLAWLATTARAYALARRHRWPQHRRWMIRSYALTLAAVTLRIQIPLAIVAWMPFETCYPVIAWSCWVPNLLVAEGILRR